MVYLTLTTLFFFSLCLALPLLPLLAYFTPLLSSSFPSHVVLLLSLLFLVPAPDIQTLPRVYFFDSYATIQTNGSDSRFFDVFYLVTLAFLLPTPLLYSLVAHLSVLCCLCDFSLPCSWPLCCSLSVFLHGVSTLLFCCFLTIF